MVLPSTNEGIVACLRKTCKSNCQILQIEQHSSESFLFLSFEYDLVFTLHFCSLGTNEVFFENILVEVFRKIS